MKFGANLAYSVAQMGSGLEFRTNAVTCLSISCTIATMLRSAVRSLQVAWQSHGAAAPTQYLQPPRASQIPISTSVPLPLPFTGCRKWKTWHEGQNASLLASADHFTEDTWCGYYTGLGGNGLRYIDPPMSGIRFWSVPSPGGLSLRADDCRDGVGPFRISGNFKPTNKDGTGETAFTGLKEYTNSSTVWKWDLRVTPFGLSGFWGSDDLHYGHQFENGMSKLGFVWLWKESWTSGS